MTRKRLNGLGEEISDLSCFVIGLTVVLWALEVVNSSMQHSLCSWGILPRTFKGLGGIPLAPFLHSGFQHLALNTIPLLILSSLVFLRGGRIFARVTVFIILAGGFGVWLFGRPAYHVGASGLLFGYFGYLATAGWFDRRFSSILIAIAVFAGYGGVLWGILPTVEMVSWEAHLVSLGAGVLAAGLFPRAVT